MGLTIVKLAQGRRAGFGGFVESQRNEEKAIDNEIMLRYHENTAEATPVNAHAAEIIIDDGGEVVKAKSEKTL